MLASRGRWAAGLCYGGSCLFPLALGWSLELTRHAPLSALTPTGGGGMAAGIAAIVKALKPSVQVIGVEPTGACLPAAGWLAG